MLVGLCDDILLEDLPTKILVTGGAGFIGSHIVEAYLAAGHQVAVLDDLSTGFTHNIPSGVKLHRVDIRNETALDEVFAEERPEVLNHQAARANVRESFDKPAEYAEVNLIGSINLLAMCRKHRVTKVIYASTGGAVYGEPTTLPVSEDHAINPLDPYGATKHHVEHHLFLSKANFGIDYTILRYPNVYGPRQNPHGEAGVIAIFTALMLAGRQPIIHGTGEQQRDFLHVSDVAHASVLSLDGGNGGIYNLGSGVGTSVNTIFDELAAATGFTGGRVHGPAKTGEVSRIFLNAARARAKLNWEPRMALRPGIESTVASFVAG
jgi:UDP-glucose 4-epimerase